MRFEMDSEASSAVGATLFSSDLALRDGAVAIANAGALALHGLVDPDPQLSEAVRAFVRAHLLVIELAAAASSGLGHRLTWAAQSAHAVELATAAELGASGQLAPTGVPLPRAPSIVQAAFAHAATSS